MTEGKKRSGAVIGGWVCFALGVALMFMTLWSALIYAPLFLVAFVLAIVAIAQKRVLNGVMLLLASLIVPFVLLVGLGATRTAKMAHESEASSQPTAAAPAAAPARPVYRTSADQLYRDYDANEVATANKIGDRVVEVSGTVDSINKDAFDNIVIELRTSSEFMSASMSMKDAEAGRAAALSKGDAVIIRCETMKRIMGSPAGDDCVFGSNG